MQTVTVLLPYLIVAVVLLAAAAMRAWEIFNARVDLLVSAILCVIAAVVAGSFDLGTDVISYRFFFSELLRLADIANWWEPGFSALGWVFASMGAPYGLFVFVCVLTSHLIKLYVFNELVSNRLLALFIVYCLTIGEVAFVRQYLAASLLLLAYLLLTRRKSWSAISVIVLAGLIHKTALLAGAGLFVVFYGFKAVWPLASVCAVAAAAALTLPGLSSAIASRIEIQVASYLVEGFVQGYESSQISLFRNVAKFPGYIVFVLWMMLLSKSSNGGYAQKKSDQFVILFSLMTMGLIVFLSPIFTRLNMYVVPFVAISVRPERFQPYASQFAGQYVAAGALIIYLMISLYPLAEYF